MQLTCPNCGARYRVDASLWPTETGPDGAVRFRPRKARCKACMTVFDAIPEEDILDLEDPLPPVSGAAPDMPSRPAPAPEPVTEPEPAPEPEPVAPAPAVAQAGLNPIEAAWPAVSAWPEPAAPGVIHFEAPPVPLPAATAGGGAPATRPAVRLPGPGALTAPVPAQAVIAAGAPQPASPAAAEPGAQPADPIDDPDDDDPDDDEADEDRPRARWPWVLAALLLAGAGWWWAVASGRIDPAAVGLPPYDPARLPGWAQPAARMLGTVALPGLSGNGLSMPALSLPAIALPRTPPPPLTVAAEAVRRPLGADRQVWEISAIVSNPTGGGIGVPPVELLLLDSAGRPVSRWTVRPDVAWLPPGGSTRLETSAVAPPAGAERVRVQLKPSDPGRL